MAKSEGIVTKSVGWVYKTLFKQGGSRKFKPKYARNKPCHCGSGVKYKKCCGF